MSTDKKQFYNRLSALSPNHENIAYTVLDGETVWEKGLCSNGILVWTSDEGGFLSEHGDVVSGIRETGIHLVDNRRVYAEVIGHEKKLVICGAGHVSMPVIRLGLMIGFSVTVIDDREMFAENARQEGAKAVCDTFAHALEEIPSDPDTYYVIVTRGHRWDRDCLRAIAKKPHAYIGLMGSRRRVGMVLDALLEEGLPADVLDRVYTPIGLRIGAETPEEISVSIMAEIIEVKNRVKRASGYTKEMMGAILAEGSGNVRQIMSTIIGRRGSAPRDISTKMLIPENGSCIGTIGGGLAEAVIIEEARRMFRAGEQIPRILHVDLTLETAEDEGMVCGGTIEVLMEPLYS